MDEANKITITICGDGGCGKSSITLRLVRSQWTHEYDPTIEDSYSVTRNIDGTTYSLELTDTAGQEEYRGLWSSSTIKSDGFLLVYDITQHNSLLQLEHFNQLIEMERGNRVERRQVQPVCIVAGNKCDLQGMRQVGATEGLNWARSRGYGFMETSAREMVNIEETFALLVRRVVTARKQHQEGVRPTLPSFTSRTQALEPLSPTDEKALPPESRDSLPPQQYQRQNQHWEPGEELQKKRWWHQITKYACW